VVRCNHRHVFLSGFVSTLFLIWIGYNSYPIGFQPNNAIIRDFAKSLLEEFGHKLPQPHAKYLGDSIFELRFSGVEGSVRVLYFFFHQDKAILTNGFLKKNNRTPKREKELAIERRKTFLAVRK